MDIDLTTNWSQPALEALLSRLYTAARRYRAHYLPSGSTPTFILPARNPDARQKLELALFAYFTARYGPANCQHAIHHLGSSPNDSVIHFPEHNISLLIMDV